MRPLTTIYELVEHIEREYDNPAALNEWVDGKWVPTSSKEMVKLIKLLAYGLISIGLRPGDKVAILANSTACWTMADLSIIIAGGITVPLFANMSHESFIFEVAQANIRFIFVEGHEQWQMFGKFHYLFEKVIRLEKAISLGAGLAEVDGSMLYGTVLKMGEVLQKERPDLLAEIAKNVKPDDVATIIYTSGSTGIPKGAETTHRCLLHFVSVDVFGWGKDDRYLNLLPLAHIFARIINIIMVARNVTCYYLTDLSQFQPVCKHLRPTLMIVVPRLLEKVYLGIMSTTRRLPIFMRKLGEWAIELAKKESPSFLERIFLFPIANLLVWRNICNQFGASFRVILCGGAALENSLNRFFVRVGFPIYEGWGLTEGSTAVVNNPEKCKIGTVGTPLPGAVIKISQEGEILLGGPTVMKGYYRNREATEAVIDSEGWLHTGDKGEIDVDGFLLIKGRLRDHFKLSTGEYFSAGRMEQWLCQDPLIDQALVIGEGRRHVAALLFPDFATVKQLKLKYNLTQISDQEFIETDFFKKQIAELIDSVNQRASSWEKIMQYRLIPVKLSMAGGELTPTMKLRRDVIKKKYQELIRTIYNEGKE